MVTNSFFDVHTHSLKINDDKRAIHNIYQDFHQTEHYQYCSMGIHPWYINDQWETTWKNVQNAAKQHNVVAIGETGLDKITTVSFALQQKLFALHIQLANQLQKPLIIHCVRAFDEVLQQLSFQKNKVPVIFHGFNKSIALAHTLVQQGFYISFGKAITKYTNEDFKVLPLTNIFVETDDADMSIEKIYELAALRFNIDVNVFSLHIQQNATTVFGKNIVWV